MTKLSLGKKGVYLPYTSTSLSRKSGQESEQSQKQNLQSDVLAGVYFAFVLPASL